MDAIESCWATLARHIQTSYQANTLQDSFKPKTRSVKSHFLRLYGRCVKAESSYVLDLTQSSLGYVNTSSEHAQSRISA